MNSVTVSDTERPPTQFGERTQASHAVAWTLFRKGIMAVLSRNLEEAIVQLFGRAAADQQEDTNEESKRLRMPLLNQVTLSAIMSGEDKRDPLRWQDDFATMVDTYMTAHNMASFATHTKAPGGRAEGDAMLKLDFTEWAIKESMHPAGDMDIKKEQGNWRVGGDYNWQNPQHVLDAAIALMDLDNRQSAKDQYHTVQEWLDMLSLNFPHTMSRYRAWFNFKISLWRQPLGASADIRNMWQGLERWRMGKRD